MVKQKSSWNKGLPREQQPWFGRKHTEKSKKKMSEIHQKAFKDGRIPWNKGLTKEMDKRLIVSDETRKKMSEISKGRIPSEASRKKLRASILRGYREGGRVAWHKGLSKEEDPRVRKMAKSIKKSWEGRKPSEKMMEFLEKHNKNRGWVTENVRRKMSEGLKKFYETHDGFNKGKNLSEKTKDKIRRARLKQKIPTEDTTIERHVKEELADRGIQFKENIPVCNICIPDIVFPEHQVAIFCDGDYWHSKTFNGGKTWRKDRKQDKKLKENGWIPIRFWGHEIRDNVKNCVDQIIEQMNECGDI